MFGAIRRKFKALLSGRQKAKGTEERTLPPTSNAAMEIWTTSGGIQPSGSAATTRQAQRSQSSSASGLAEIRQDKQPGDKLTLRQIIDTIDQQLGPGFKGTERANFKAALQAMESRNPGGLAPTDKELARIFREAQPGHAGLVALRHTIETPQGAAENGSPASIHAVAQLAAQLAKMGQARELVEAQERREGLQPAAQALTTVRHLWQAEQLQGLSHALQTATGTGRLSQGVQPTRDDVRLAAPSLAAEPVPLRLPLRLKDPGPAASRGDQNSRETVARPPAHALKRTREADSLDEARSWQITNRPLKILKQSHQSADPDRSSAGHVAVPSEATHAPERGERHAASTVQTVTRPARSLEFRSRDTRGD
jgi:hypothetical protein